MHDNIVVQGIVLDTSLIKEYDKRLVILTSKLGRITVFANGARRTNSALTAASQKFVMREFTVRPSGQNAYSLVSASIKDTFLELSYDLEKMAYASYACELAGYFTREGMSALDELNLLYVTFKAILNEAPSISLIKSAFEIKLLDIEGLASLEAFTGGEVLSPDTVNIINYILSREISELYSFDVGDKIKLELEKITDKYLKTQCDRHFKSLDILKPLV
jgi:DNA repair protein RecO (recombination protein O)